MNQDDSPMEIDPHVAEQLFETGAAVIISGVPMGTEFGIDLTAYTIGPNFRGVKMIPPGFHMIWCAAKGPYGDVAPRVGFGHFFQEAEIYVREWDVENEELRPRQLSESDAELERQRLREHLKDLDKFLAPYDLRYFSNWKELIIDVTKDIMERCRPANGPIRSNVELQSCPDSERPRGAEMKPMLKDLNFIADEEELLPNLKPIEGTAPRFTEVPDRIPKNATPAEITRHNIDCIAALDKLLQLFGDNKNELVEEIEVAFVFYLVANSVESLAHWRKILAISARSQIGVEKHHLFYMKYSEILGSQLPYLPEELMEPTERNTVFKDVRTLLTNLYLGGLIVSAERLSKKLTKSMNWHFEGLLDEDPEDFPVIVET